MDFLRKLTELTEKRNELNKELGKELMAAIKETIKEVFKNDKVLQIAWYQYTMNWNDGDNCYFKVYEPRITFRDLEDEVFLSEFNYDDDIGQLLTERENVLIENLYEACRNNKDLMQDLFGNGVEVICTSNAIEIRDYSDHD
jgi:hypothetical protein